MAIFKQNYFQRRTKPRGPRANNRINSHEVQVISSKGQNLGILSTKEALHLAEQEGLDLIEIAPKSKPPVCKIIDMGKYKYELQKKANKAKKKQKISELKEIKLRPNSEDETSQNRTTSRKNQTIPIKIRCSKVKTIPKAKKKGTKDL